MAARLVNDTEATETIRDRRIVVGLEVTADGFRAHSPTVVLVESAGKNVQLAAQGATDLVG